MTGTVLVGLMAGLTGCVSQGELDSAMDTNRSLESQNADLRSRVDSQGQQIAQLKTAGGSAGGTIGELQTENGQLRTRLHGAVSTIADLEDRISTLNFVRLDPATDLALSRFAKQHSGLITYDSDRGMLRFSSDLTFRSGSDEVKAEAATSLAALAQVFDTAEAGNYDLRIVGHTDNEAISSATAARHATNMHLSAHRAIAVRRQLGQSVGWDRMSIEGWGENRPLMANNPTGGTAGNRRVEIFVVPSSRGAISGGATAVVDVDRQQPPAQIDPTK